MKNALILRQYYIREIGQRADGGENGYLVSEAGVITGVFRQLPERYESAAVRDYGDSLIIPGLVDLHLHAPQYAIRGMGMDWN